MKKSGASIDSIVLTFVKLLTIGLSFVIVKILSTQLSLSDYGSYSAAMVLVSVGSSICIMGMLDATNFFFNQSATLEDHKRVVSTIFFIEVVIGSLFAAVALIFREQLAAYFGIRELASLIGWVAWLPLMTNLISIYQILYISKHQTKLIGAISFVATLLKLAYISYLCFSTQNLKMIFLCMLCFELFQTVLMGVVFFKISKIGLSIKAVNFRSICQILKFAVPMGAYIWVNTLTREADKVIVSHLGGAEELALYTNAAKLLPLDILTGAFMTVLIPYITRYLAKGKGQAAAEALSYFFQISMLAIWGLALGIFLQPEGLITILYSKEYIPAKTVFVLYVVVDMVRFAQTSILFSAKGKSVLLLRYSIIMLVANIGLDFLFYRMMGFVGPAIATVIVNIVQSAYMIKKGAELISQPVSSLMPSRALWKLLARLTAAFLLGIIIHKIVEVLILDLSMEFIITYACYLVVVIALNYKQAFLIIKKINKLAIE